MVDAGHHGVDRGEVGVEQQAQDELEAHDLGAQPDGLDRRSPWSQPEHSAVRGLLTLMSSASGQHRSMALRHLEDDGHAAQRPGDAAGPDAVAHGLAHAVARAGSRCRGACWRTRRPRRWRSRTRRRDSASSMSVVARARERDPPALGHVLDHLERGRQRVGVEVVEDDLGVGSAPACWRSPPSASASSGCFLHRRA